MYKIELTNASKFDKILNSQIFKPKGKELSIPRPLVDSWSDPSDIAKCTSCHGHMSKCIYPNPKREEWCDNH